MKAYWGNGGIAPLIRNLSTRWGGILFYTKSYKMQTFGSGSHSDLIAILRIVSVWFVTKCYSLWTLSVSIMFILVKHFSL